MNKDTSEPKNPTLNIEVSSKNIDAVLKPLSNPLRQKMLMLLVEGPITYTQILTRLDIESGSFYWHIGKMEALVEQNDLKEYFLSELGKKAYELLIFDEISTPDNAEIPFRPDWYEKPFQLISKVYQLPGWVIIQQLLVVLLISFFLFGETSLIQLGTIPVVWQPNLILSIVSILGSVIGITICLIIMQLLYIRPDKEHFQKSILFLTIRLLFASSTVLLPGVIFSGLLLTGFSFIVELAIFQLVVALLCLSLSILITTSFVDKFLDLGLKDSLLIVIPPYYLIVLISFFFIQS